jgi:MutS domain V
MASAFMIDVQQIALALRACTRQSLVIIDEFGKGTESHGIILSDLPNYRWFWFILCGIGAFRKITESSTESIDGTYLTQF